MEFDPIPYRDNYQEIFSSDFECSKDELSSPFDFTSQLVKKLFDAKKKVKINSRPFK